MADTGEVTQAIAEAAGRPGASPGATDSMFGWSGLMRMQAAKWAGFISTSGGTTCLQASIT